MNLREFCVVAGFDTALLTTYQFDPLFFERVVLRDLLASGVRRVVILADAAQAAPVIASVSEQLVDLGRRYQLFLVWQTGAFHPKLCVKLSSETALVACGSTNLTYPGWLGLRTLDATAGNREISGAWRVSIGTPQAADLALALQRVFEQVPSVARSQACQGAIAEWSMLPTEVGAGQLLVSGAGVALSRQLAHRWRGRRFDRLWMATGSTDEGGAMLAWAASEFGVRHAVVETDPLASAFNPILLERLPLTVLIRPRPPQPRPHLKLAVFGNDDGLAAVYGSANCSAAAWLRTPDRGGNTEAVVVLDDVDPGAVSSLLSLDDAETLKPRTVRFGVLPDRDGPGIGPAPRLATASLVRSTRTLTFAFNRPLPSGCSVAVEMDTVSTIASPLQGELWTARLDALRETTRARFLTARIEGAVTASSMCWVDDADSLEALRHRTVDSGALTGLSNGAEDPARTLHGISRFAQWLLGDWTPDDERAAGGAAHAAQAAIGPAVIAPVTPEQIFRSIEQIQGGVLAAVVQSSGAGLSLAGIMRLVFGDATERTDVSDDPIADELRDEPVPPRTAEAPHSKDERGAPSDSPHPPSPSDRTRLARQVARFTEGLADDGFADRCTARQLQQAAAFPLACYLLATKGGWIQSDDDHERWQAVVRRVCELLMQTRIPDHDGSRSLLSHVEDRYTRLDRRSEFDAILGDGTLWVLLLAVATSAGPAADPFERQLILSDIVNCDALRSSGSEARLAGLCSAAKLHDRSGSWLEEARAAHGRVVALCAALAPLGATLPQRQKGVAREGDWLWRPSAGFATLEAVIDADMAAVHIRTKARTLPRVQLSYYVNLRLAGLAVSTLQTSPSDPP